jgi:tetratricopeptide (TPR) repeat protein
MWTGVCERFGSDDDALALLEALAPYHDQIAGGGSLWLGAVAGACGRLATKLGRLDEADAYFAEAEAVNERARAPFFLARDRVAWARMLGARGQTGDEERARELLTSALEVARQFGCVPVIDEATALLGELDAS